MGRHTSEERPPWESCGTPEEFACEELGDTRPLTTLTTKELGRVGEAVAAMYLSGHGYEVLERNYRCAEGEADLIAYDRAEDVVVLAEVKTRRVRNLDESIFPEEAVNAKKRRRYRRIAACYAMDRFPVHAIRFDVIAVTVSGGTVAGVEHLVAAFDWDAEL